MATLNAASQAFEEKNYSQAKKLWATSVGQYVKATEYSRGVSSVRTARGKYERALVGCNSTKIQQYAAEQWRVITAEVQDAEAAYKAGQFATAVSVYEKATGLLPAAERVAESRIDAKVAALLSKAQKILTSMPSDAARVTTSQNGELRQAQDAVVAALVYMPSDPEVLALKERIAAFQESVDFAKVSKLQASGDAKGSIALDAFIEKYPGNPKAKVIKKDLEKEQAFARLMSQAKVTFARMPSDPGELSDTQKSELRQAQKAVAAALVYKPSDREALALKERIAAVTNRSVPAPVANGGGGRLPLSQLSQAPAGPRRTATLQWLIENPKPEVLPDITKLWDSEAPNGPDEQLFRQAVAKLGPGKWQDVLLDSLNAKKFAARGSALSVLAARRAEIDLLNRIKLMSAKIVFVRSMQAFAEKFGYIPANGEELLACVIIHAGVKDSLEAPARLAAQWKAEHKYKFNIRDFHLLSRLAPDPLRNKTGRDELVKKIVTKLGRRRHVAGGGGPFSKQAARMTMPDLWNIVLLDEMLRQRRVTLALRILADRLRAGLSSPRSGLIFYEGGKASAKLYPQAVDSSRGDRDHIPERELQRAGFGALCHLHTRFETVYNGDRAPASKREVSASNQGNFYGLVLTSIDSSTFSAFYYNPNGAVVSLGLFAFGK